ncbi:MAG: MFS transporter [Bifidobacteriaceae bacterium]|jgi:MFS family permease|nr:MFS transporter [Bifidobacteriaceae bacterium]
MSRPRVVRDLPLVIVFIVSVVVIALADSTYDMAFVNSALNISDQVAVVGWIYCAGYLTEAFASVALGPKIDSWGPLRAMAVFAGLVVAVLAGVGLADHAVGVTSGILVIVIAAVIDFLNQLVAIAHEAALPEVFGQDEAGLIRFAGLDSSVRSVASIASPVVAGLIIFQMPGFEALAVVAVLFGLGYGLLMAFLLGKARRRAATGNGAHGSGADGSLESDGQLPSEDAVGLPDGFRATARAIWESTAWRTFLIVDVSATMALSTVLLLLYSLFKHDFQLSPLQSGALLGCMALGSFIAAVLVARGSKESLSRLFGIGAVCAGGGTLLLAVANGHLIVGGAGTVVLGFGSVFQLRAMTLLIQLNAPKGKIASGLSVFDATERIVNGAAIVALAFCMDRLGGAVVFAAMGVVLVGSGVAWMLIRRTVWHPAATAVEAPSAER